MRSRVRVHVRQNVVAYLALFVALGGTSYAGTNLPRQSVGTKQLARDAVTAGKIRSGAVRSADIKDGTVALRDLSAASARALKGDKGDPGEKGDKGEPGQPGQPGANAATSVVVRSQVFAVGGTVAASGTTFRAPCAAGERAVGGGSALLNSSAFGSLPDRPSPETGGGTPDGWEAVQNRSSNLAFGTGESLEVYAVCAAP